MNLPTGTVTFLFTDIEGSTRLWEEYPEPMRQALARHDTLLYETIRHHKGFVFKTVGDAFCAAFQFPQEAFEAAVEAQQRLHNEAWPEEIGALRVRMAVHTGAAEERDRDYFGPPVNRVARLLSIGHGGQTLLSQVTYESVRISLPEAVTLRDMQAHRLKDLLQPEHVYQLVLPGLPADFPPLRSLENQPNNLPKQLTSFIGREEEIVAIKTRLESARLLTLTGIGGTGKTRLGLHVAAHLLDAFPDGVWLVELASLADPALVPQTVATALGVREEAHRPITQTLADYLRQKRTLLVLDNCEHLLSGCASLVNDLLQSGPNVRILATSRESLGILGEQNYRIPSLSLPPSKRLPSLETLLQFEAVSLFVDRATLGHPVFALTAENAPAVVQTCRRLDGIPLRHRTGGGPCPRAPGGRSRGPSG